MELEENGEPWDTALFDYWSELLGNHNVKLKPAPENYHNNFPKSELEITWKQEEADEAHVGDPLFAI